MRGRSAAGRAAAGTPCRAAGRTPGRRGPATARCHLSAASVRSRTWRPGCAAARGARRTRASRSRWTATGSAAPGRAGAGCGSSPKYAAVSASTRSGSKSRLGRDVAQLEARVVVAGELVVDDADDAAGVDEVLRQQVVVARHGRQRCRGQRARRSRSTAASRSSVPVRHRAGRGAGRCRSSSCSLATMEKSLSNRGPACSRRQAAADAGNGRRRRERRRRVNVRPGRNSSTSAGTSGSTSKTRAPTPVSAARRVLAISCSGGMPSPAADDRRVEHPQHVRAPAAVDDPDLVAEPAGQRAVGHDPAGEHRDAAQHVLDRWPCTHLRPPFRTVGPE